MKKKDIEKVAYRTVQAAEVAYPYVAAAFLHEIKGEPHLFVELYKNEERPVVGSRTGKRERQDAGTLYWET